MKKVIIIILFIYMCGCTHQVEQSNNAPVSSPSSESHLFNQQNVDFSLPMFSSDSPFNIPVKDNYTIDENSDIMINCLLKDLERKADSILSVKYWSVTVFFTDENTKRYDVALTNKWGLGYKYIKDVPIPYNAQPDPKNDGHMTIIDTASGFVYEFWQFNKSDTTYSATWGNRISLLSNGIYPYGMSSRGSGFSSLLGVIWPHEFKKGSIDHALVLSIPSTKAGGPVSPATESDGFTIKSGAIPIGARLILDPTLDLSTLKLTYYERVICECLQKYGAFVGDTSGSIEFEAINPLSFNDDAYNGMFTDEWIFLNNIPFDKLQVLSMNEQIKNPPLKVMDDNIYD